MKKSLKNVFIAKGIIYYITIITCIRDVGILRFWSIKLSLEAFIIFCFYFIK